MAGSAIGAVLPAALLPVFGEENIILLVSLLPLVLIPFRFRKIDRTMQKLVIAGVVTILAFSSILLFHPKASSMIRIVPSSYKALRQTLRFPHTEIVETRSGIRGRMNRVESPYIRFAPGLSLKFKGTLPKQGAVFKDGDVRCMKFTTADSSQINTTLLDYMELSISFWHSGHLQITL